MKPSISAASDLSGSFAMIADETTGFVATRQGGNEVLEV
jgi:hypothetical protein